MGRGGGALPQASRTGPVRRGRVKIEEGVPLARLTTVGIGGPARALARPRTLAELEDALAWAAERGLAGAADRARLEPARCRRGRRRARRPARGRARGGRGARDECSSPAAAQRTPSASIAPAPPASAGFEFACAIPGTAGGGVRMNAGAYGSDWKAILVRALVVDASGARWRTERGARALATATPPSSRGRWSPGSSSSSPSAPAPRSRRRSPTMQTRRKDDAADEQAHVRKRVQESRPRARGRADDRALRPEGPPHRRGDRSRPATRTSSRTPAGATARDAIALMVEARRRAHDQFGVALEREVELLGDLELPGPLASDAGPRRPRRTEAGMAARHRRLRRRRQRPPAPARRGGRARARRSGSARTSLPGETSIFALERIQVTGAARRRRRGSGRRSRSYVGESLVRFDRSDAARRLAAVVGGRRRAVRPRLPAHAEGPGAPGAARRGAPARVPTPGSSPPARASWASSRRPYPRLPRIWLPARHRRLGQLDARRASRARGVAAVAPLRPLHGRRGRAPGADGDGELTLVLASGTELAPRRQRRPAAEAVDREADPPARRRCSVRRRQRPGAASRRVQLSSRRLRLSVCPCKSR